MVYTFNGTNHTMYLDGSPQVISPGVSPNPQNVPVAEALIGNYLNGNERPIVRIDDVRIWKDRTLTGAEVSALFSGK
jgi:hypothetical protein